MTDDGDREAPQGPDPHRRVLPVGDRALLVECADLAEVRGLHAALIDDPVPGQGELLPAARTVLVRLTHPDRAAAVAHRLSTVRARPPAADAHHEVVIHTVYDGADLDDVADALGMSAEAVARAHGERSWTAAFVGFAPGFAYLERDGAPFDIPRRSSPRTSVPAGSVALAGPYSAVYPRASPGGWQLIGRTDAPMWDLGRPEPALVRAGTRVRFRAVRGRAVGASHRPDTSDADVAPGAAATPPGGAAASDATAGPDAVATGTRARSADAPGLEVLATGALSLVQDLGRPGHLGLGVSPSGALDRAAAVRANRLVGNARGAAVLETVLGGLVLRARGHHVLAVTGAPAPLSVQRPDGTERDRPSAATPFAVHDGEVLAVEPPEAGVRSYVAVRGGLALDPVLGSRATDVLSGLGPPPVRTGDVLPVGPPPQDAVAAWPEAVVGSATSAPAVTEVRVVLGPRADWLTADGVGRLCGRPWTVTPQSNRVGLRLDGEPLDRAIAGELPSEGVVAGAVQVPPSGLPVVFLADHPVTGGYPVAAVVVDADLDRLAQLRPGDVLRFVADPPPEPPRADRLAAPDPADRPDRLDRLSARPARP